MLRFFRQIRQKLIQEDKVRRYLIYAIGEIALVMIGILLALQVNNWNEERKQKQTEYNALIDLKEEFRANRVSLEYNLNRKTEGVTHTRYLLNAVISQEIDTVLNYQGHVGAYTYNPSDGVLNSLLSTGQINLISNDELRYKLANWKNKVEDVQEDELFHLDFIFSRLDPFRQEHLSYSEYMLQDSSYNSWVQSNNELIKQRLLNTGQLNLFINLLANNLIYLNRMVNEFSEFDQEFKEVEQLLEQELLKFERK